MKHNYIAFVGTPRDLEIATHVLYIVATLNFDTRPIKLHHKEQKVVVEFPFMENFNELYQMYLDKITESDYNGRIPRIVIPA